jgi:hypothetical protein
VNVHELRLDRLVYATVVLMSVLVVFDGWQELVTYLGVAAVIAGPLLALALAHVFAEGLHAHVELHRTLTRHEWVRLVRDQASVLLAAVPPLVVLGIGWVSTLDALSTITVLLWTGVLTLMALAGFAGRQAGFRGWRLIVVSLCGGFVGLVVISLQIVLKPH